MKTFVSILLITFVNLSCSDPLTPDNFIQTKNTHSGLWEVHLSGDLSGAATIILQSSGFIHNGIPINFGIAKVNTYIKGSVKESGTLQADFYNSFIKDSVSIISDGIFVGTFSDSACSGSYSLVTNDTLNYSGTWNGFRIE